MTTPSSPIEPPSDSINEKMRTSYNAETMWTRPSRAVEPPSDSLASSPRVKDRQVRPMGHGPVPGDATRAIEPPSISIFTELLIESTKLTGCRGEAGVPGLGTCCDYHEGFWDGMHALAGRYGS